MMIIGVDYHPSFQQIAFLMEETGEYGEHELSHSDGEAERFYRELRQRGILVRVGMEATGYTTRGSERSSVLEKRKEKAKKDLTEPALLEMSLTGKNRDFRSLSWATWLPLKSEPLRFRGVATAHRIAGDGNSTIH